MLKDKFIIPSLSDQLKYIKITKLYLISFKNFLYLCDFKKCFKTYKDYSIIYIINNYIYSRNCFL